MANDALEMSLSRASRDQKVYNLQDYNLALIRMLL